MIIFDGFKEENKKVTFIEFRNEEGIRISIPLTNDVAKTIKAHLRLLSNNSNKLSEADNS